MTGRVILLLAILVVSLGSIAVSSAPERPVNIQNETRSQLWGKPRQPVGVEIIAVDAHELAVKVTSEISGTFAATLRLPEGVTLVDGQTELQGTIVAGEYRTFSARVSYGDGYYEAVADVTMEKTGARFAACATHAWGTAPEAASVTEYTLEEDAATGETARVYPARSR